MSSIPILARAEKHQQRTAIIDNQGNYTYAELIAAARSVAAHLLADQHDLIERRVAFMVPPGFYYAATQWGIWMAGGIAVPLCTSHPLPEIEYVLQDCDADTLVLHEQFAEKLAPLIERYPLRVFDAVEASAGASGTLPQVEPGRRAMILYTSGTTSRPKGVVSTHRNIAAQISTLITAWEWRADDHILHVLPLHHTHGIINVLSCALWAGAVCEMLPAFDAGEVWRRFVDSELTLFMAVPTIYIRLIDYWQQADPGQQKELSEACSKMRLMVSGSAALPVSIFQKWQDISGHTLLERYGMTEIGMAISNPLHGERRPGYIGQPLPGMEARLFDENGEIISAEGQPGEIRVRGEGVFKEYWRKPEATREAFRDGWFCTGDVAVVEDGYFRILGRSSVDIIKTGGYKVSALEIEEVLRTHPQIKECAVVGIPDEDWGERVAAALICPGGESLTLPELREWAKERLAVYKIPSCLKIVSDLPRNVMGKVTKPEVKRLFGET